MMMSGSCLTGCAKSFQEIVTLIIDLCLNNSWHVVLDRVFYGNNFDLRCMNLFKKSIQRGRYQNQSDQWLESFHQAFPFLL